MHYKVPRIAECSIVQLGRMVFLYASVLLLATFSITEQQMCPLDNGKDETVCVDENNGWISNISRAGGSSNGGRSFEVMWDRNLNLSTTTPGGYVVMYRQLGPVGPARALNPTRINEGFTIMNLRPNTRYDAMVCLPGRMPSSNFELSPRCGNCRLCFRTGTNMRETIPPIIIESTVQELPQDLGLIYECKAVGDPLPNLIWSALNFSSGNRQRLQNSIEGITISTQTTTEVKSQLTISSKAEFKQPMCTADNGIGRVTQKKFMMVPPSPTTNIESTIPLSTIIGILVPTLIIVFLVAGVVVCICCIKNRPHKIKRPKSFLHDSSMDERQVHVAEMPFWTTNQSLIQKLPNTLIISPSEIEVSTVIGQGEFGVIYKGILKSDLMNAVAIKTLKGIFATASDIESVSKEIEKMQHFEHPNVMSLIGVCMAPSEQGTSSGGPCIVMPFMAKGSILDQLRKESEELNVTTKDDKNFDGVKKVLLQMCLQIAKGMEYLADLKFVHRDLAARNCLVDASGIIKVSDFGLAEDIYSQNYFRQVEGSTKLPLKWMALESITQGKFSEKSDVWSYGITCWEVFTGGSTPYPGMHPREVLEFLQNEERSARPKNAACDSDMFTLMQSCWEHKDTSRPSFSDIVSYLTSHLEYTSDYLDLTGLKNSPPTINLNGGSSVGYARPSTESRSRFDSLLHSPVSTNEYYNANY